MRSDTCPECGGTDNKHYLSCSTWQQFPEMAKKMVPTDRPVDPFDNPLDHEPTHIKRETGWWVVPMCIGFILIFLFIMIGSYAITKVFG
jgi:hypothetical protein